MYGASPRTVENSVTSRLESALARMKGVKGISSKSSGGSGYVTIELDRHADMEKIRFEASTIVRQIWSELPDGVSYPAIQLRVVNQESSGPFMVLSLNAGHDSTEIQEYGEENLKPMLANIDGVSDVSLSGATPKEWKLKYDSDRLAATGLTHDDLRVAIARHMETYSIAIASSVSPGGGNEEYVRVTLKSAEPDKRFNPKEIPVELATGKWIPLSQLVTVERVESRPYQHFRVNGLNSIYVSITADEDANQLIMSKNIRNALSALHGSMPDGYYVDILYDCADNIRDELRNILTRSGLTIVILLLFVGMVSLSWRYMLMISVSLIMNLAIAALLYFLARIEIQLYSLAGITISLNLIIDNLIVMADHYSRNYDRRVFTSILAATLTTVGALSVVYLMDETTRLSLQDFVSVVIINLSVSLFVALFLIPALTDNLLKTEKGNKTTRIKRLSTRIAFRISNTYSEVLKLMMKVKWVMYVLVAAAFVWTTFLFATKVYNGKYWNREITEPVLKIFANLPNGATIEQMDALVRKMEAFLQGIPQIEQFQTRIYGGRRGIMEVRFTKENQRNGYPYRLKSEVISKAMTLGGGDWTVTGLEDMGFNNSVMELAGKYRVKLTGYNYDDLNAWTMRLRDSLLSHRRIQDVTVNSELSSWRPDYSEFYLIIDRGRMADTGITANELFRTLSSLFGRGIDSGSTIADGKSERIKLYSEQSGTYDVYSLLHRPVKVGDRWVKISEFASVEKVEASKEIIKRNQQYELCLQYDYLGSEKQAKRILKKELESINSLMPAGYHAIDAAEDWKVKDKNGKYWLIGLVTVIIFFITSILFDSIRLPMVIIFMIPVSFIGVFATFSIFDLKFDQGGFASLILLAGITVNAAIYVVSEYMSLLSQFPKRSRMALYQKAIRVKIVPVFLTVMSTVLGFLPFLMGIDKESFWFPLAAGTVGGLMVSIPALLIYLPLLLLKK